MPEKGIAITPYGYRASIRIHGVLHQKRFPKDTPLLTIKTWRLKTEMKYRRGTKTSGLFADDAARYLVTVQSMASFAHRQLHIKLWSQTFNGRRRDDITADEITAQLHAWRAAGLAPSTVNKRRSALMHMYRVLDGRAAPNPVRDTPKFQEPAPAPRALPYEWIDRIFAAMPASKTKARLMVIAYTGLPPSLIQTIAADDVHYKAATVAVAGRKKGTGTDARIMPLTKQGLRAFRQMQRADAWGSFSRTSISKVFRRACIRALGKDILKHYHFRPYDLRHSFGTKVYESSGDIRATQILMGHSSPTLTHRYTLAAIDPRIRDAVKRVNRAGFR